MFHDRLSTSPVRICGAAVLLSLTIGCASGGWMEGRPATCATFDSLFQYSGFEVPLTLQGKLTVDAAQYRIRGKTRIETTPAGDVSVDFTSTVLFGAHREDFFFSIVADTLRILDRERGEYYESTEANRFMNESLGLHFDAKTVILMALGRAASCDDLRNLRMELGSGGDIRFVGRTSRDRFEAVFAARHHKLKRISWPLTLEGQRDRLHVTYDWKKGKKDEFVLRQVVIRLLEREWRCKITAANI